MANFELQVTATLNPSKLISQLKEIEKTELVFSNVQIKSKDFTQLLSKAASQAKIEIGSNNIQLNTNVGKKLGTELGKAIATGMNGAAGSEKLLEKIMSSINTGKLDKSVNAMKTQAGKLKGAYAEVPEVIKQVDVALKDLNSNVNGKSAEQLIAQYNQFNTALATASNRISVLSSQEKHQVSGNTALNEMVSTAKQLSSLRIELSKMEIMGNQSGIAAAKQNISDLIARMGQLKEQIGSGYINTAQWKEIEQIETSTTAAITKLQEAAQKTNFGTLLSQISSMGSISKQLTLLDPDREANQISQLKSRLQEIRQEYSALRQEMSGSLNVEQTKQLDAAWSKVSSTINMANAKAKDTALAQTFSQLEKYAKQMDSLRVNAKKLQLSPDANTEQLNRLSERYDVVRSKFEALKSTLSGSQLSGSQMASVNAILAETEAKLADLQAKAKDATASMAQGIRESMAAGQYSSGFNHLQEQFSALKNVTPEIAASMRELQSAYTAMVSSSSNDKLVENEKKYQAQLKQTSTLLKEATSAQKVMSQSNTLSSNITTWMNNNKKAAAAFGTTLREIQTQLSGNFDSSKLSLLSTRFNEVKAAAEAAKLTTRGYGTSLKSMVLMALGVGDAFMVMMKTIETIKKGVSTVIELDTALIDLKKTTTMSSNELAQFYTEANQSAKQYGTTTKEIISSAADWSRLGYSSKQEVSQMAKMSSIMKSISPGMDIDSATKGLVSIMKAFGDMDTSNVLDGVISKINAVGNTAATSNAEIVEGLQQSSAAMAVMGTSFDETVALFTAGQEITQDASKVGKRIA